MKAGKFILLLVAATIWGYAAGGVYGYWSLHGLEPVLLIVLSAMSISIPFVLANSGRKR